MTKREYEIAAGRPLDLEYGGGGFVSAVDGKSISVAQPNEEVRQHLQGYGLRWRTIVEYKGQLIYFEPHAIKNPMWGEPKRLLFDHDESEIYATTQSGLQLHCDDYGLAMRLVIGKDPKRRKAYETVKRGERTALSAGLIMHGGEFFDIEGARIKVIKSATLEELSLVPVGACKPAFCGLIDADGARSLEDDAESLRILKDSSANRVTKALAALQEALRNRH
ncbi:HK97 family phage prohead protease [Bradyrhizobium sp. 199]|uniref:HK97 family phage prohead protease n=1 Tax=Bradyrhizobium sp. 199 TaxID=2782664 RepID=UPI001FFBC33F|nr:HK97 family phage prohead protease [Bradyrhizobium sp. 199]MCK1357351.1 HK97 family phage prohead protease [Bradyrhizobium sp. 199]